MNRRDLLRSGLLAATAFGSAPFFSVARADAPDIFSMAFPAPDGNTRELADFLGKPVVLNFWATWCPPCVKEMPDLDALQTKHKGVNIVGLAVDTAVNVVKFGERVKVSYPLLVAGHGGIRLMKDLGNPQGGLPFTLVFDADGRPLKHFLGQISRPELDATLTDIATV